MGKQSRRVREKTGKHPSKLPNMSNATTRPQTQIIKGSTPIPFKHKPVILENPGDFMNSVQLTQLVNFLRDFQLPCKDMSTDISCRPINETKLRMIQNMSETHVMILIKNAENESLFADIQRWLMETIYQVELSDFVYAGSLLVQYQGAFYIATSDDDVYNTYAAIQSYVATLQDLKVDACFVHCSDTKLLGSTNCDRLENKNVFVVPCASDGDS